MSVAVRAHRNHLPTREPQPDTDAKSDSRDE
jgi:hypothetical protein